MSYFLTNICVCKIRQIRQIGIFLSEVEERKTLANLINRLLLPSAALSYLITKDIEGVGRKIYEKLKSTNVLIIRVIKKIDQ